MAEAQTALNFDALPPPPDTRAQHEALLDLCAKLQEAGIYLTLNAEGKLIAGPARLVATHPRLLEGLRQHKARLLTLLHESMAYQLFGANEDDTRFETEVCPDCQQPIAVLTPPRRLAVHRLPPDWTQRCPGSERAQQACAAQLLDAFLDDQAVPRRMAVLTWTSFEGAFRVWSLRLGWLRPPKPYLLRELDKRFTRMGEDEARPMWQGLTLKQELWFGEDEEQPAKPEDAQAREQAQVVVEGKKVRLRA